MLTFIRHILNLKARRALLRNPNIRIAASAKVNWRGVGGQAFSNLSIGEGSIIEGQIISDRDGAHVSIGRDTFIGNSHIISADSIDIGDDVLISWGCYIVDHNSHPVLWKQRKDDVRNWYVGKKVWDDVSIKRVKIGNKAWLGFNVTILKGVSVGEGAIVGAGSIVTKDIPPFTTVAGNPAKVIRQVTADD